MQIFPPLYNGKVVVKFCDQTARILVSQKNEITTHDVPILQSLNCKLQLNVVCRRPTYVFIVYNTTYMKNSIRTGQIWITMLNILLYGHQIYNLILSIIHIIFVGSKSTLFNILILVAISP